MNDKKRITFMIMVLIILLIISTFIYFRSNKHNSKEVVLDNDIKNDILSKIKTISADDILIDIYRENINIDNMDYKIGIEGILLTLEEDGNIDESEADKLYKRTNICTNTSYINLDSVENKIKSIYGKTFSIDYNKILKDSNYIYDSDSKRFYELCTNSIANSNFIDTYVYNFEIDNRNAYVYVAVSYGSEEIVMESDDVTDKTKVSIYTNYKKDKLYKSYIYDGSNSSDNFILDNSNYKDFSLYKYTFKRHDNNYYFNSLERIQ